MSLVFLACGKATQRQDISWTWDTFEKSAFPQPTVSSQFNLSFLRVSRWTTQRITNQLVRSFANSEAHAAPFQISYLIDLCWLFETSKILCNALKRAQVISLVFLFWQITKSELVDRRQRRLIHSDTEATAMLFLRLILFPTQSFLSAVFDSLLSTKHYQLLCANSEFFSCVCLLFSSSFHTHTHTHALHSVMTLFTSEMFCVHIF